MIELPNFPVESVESVVEHYQKLAHPIAQIGFRCFNEQLIVFPNQNMGMNHPSGPLTHFAQALQPGLPLAFLRKNHLTTIAPGDHVIHNAGIFDSQSPGHLLMVAHVIHLEQLQST